MDLWNNVFIKFKLGGINVYLNLILKQIEYNFNQSTACVCLCV